MEIAVSRKTKDTSNADLTVDTADLKQMLKLKVNINFVSVGYIFLLELCHLLKHTLLNSDIFNFRNGKRYQLADYLAWKPLSNLTYIGIKIGVSM